MTPFCTVHRLTYLTALSRVCIVLSHVIISMLVLATIPSQVHYLPTCYLYMIIERYVPNEDHREDYEPRSRGDFRL